MAVRADASSVKNRINLLRSNLKDVADLSAQITAAETIKQVERNANAALSTQDEQVGFDLGQFIANIQSITRTQNGYAILDTQRMGTVADFEKIGDIKGLWHQHRRGGEAFRRRVYENPAARAALAEKRKAIWGNKTPQWILLEYGFSGGIPVAGAYPPVTARNFIGAVLLNRQQIFEEWKRRIRIDLISRGIL